MAQCIPAMTSQLNSLNTKDNISLSINFWLYAIRGGLDNYEGLSGE